MKRLFNIIIGTLICTYITLALVLHLPVVQSQIGSAVAAVVSQKIGSEVEVGRVDITFPNRVILDNVLIYDQQKKKMLTAARASAKIELTELLNGRISFSLVQLFSFNGAFYQTTADSPANFQFALDSLASKDTTEKDQTQLRFKSLILRRGAISWDKHYEPATPGRFNPDHMAVSDLTLLASIKELSSDSLNFSVRRLTFKEQSGLSLTDFGVSIAANRKSAELSDLKVLLPHSQIKVPAASATYDFRETGFVLSNSRAQITNSTITPSDLVAVVPALADLSQPVSLRADLEASNSAIDIKNLFVGTDLSDSKLPAPVKSLAKVSIEGNASLARIVQQASLKLTTSLGKVDVDGKHEGDQVLAHLTTEGFDIGTLLADEKVGQLAANVELSALTNGKKISKATTKGTIQKFEYNDYLYKDINIDADLAGDVVNGNISVKDPNIDFVAKGQMNTSKQQKDSHIELTLNHLRPGQLNLTKATDNTDLSGNLAARLSFSDINDIAGNMRLDDFSINGSSKGDIHLDELTAITGKDDKGHYIRIGCDFAALNINGNFTNATLLQSVINYVSRNLNAIDGMPRYERTNNQFTMAAQIIDFSLLNKILGTDIILDSPIMINGELNDAIEECSWKLSAPNVTYNGSMYRNITVSIDTPAEMLACKADIQAIDAKGHKTDYNLRADVKGNTINTHLGWSNYRRLRSGADIASTIHFSHSPIMGQVIDVDINPSHLMVQGSQWDVLPASIQYHKDRLKVNNVRAIHENQYVVIDGMASDSNQDSITVDLNGIDVEYVLNVVNFHSVDFAGKATGKAVVRNIFNTPQAYAHLRVDEFEFEHGPLGVLYANAQWNNSLHRIDIDAVAQDEGEKHILVQGYVDPVDVGFIDLDMQPNRANLAFMKSFCGSFMNNIQLEGTGRLRLHGPLNIIQLTGVAAVSGTVGITPLGTTYALDNDSVHLRPDEIELHGCQFTDIKGNHGYVSGFIRHKHLTKLTFDLDVEANRLLAYNFPDYGNETFCGEVYASGRVDLHGRPSTVTINCDVTPDEGTVFRYNASSPDAVRGQQFITWHDNTPLLDMPSSQDITEEEEQEKDGDIRTNMYLNFLVHANPKATLHLDMDQLTGDYIELRGDGSLRASYYNKGSFSLFGQYLVQDGLYKLTIQNLITKEFRFQPGGTITFGGDPYDAPLNLQALYTVSGVSLSDLNMGKSFSSNTIRVNCLMNITGQPKAPVVDFDMDLPTVNSDEKQMIRSFINSQNDMNQQVVYLLGIGRFYTQDNSNQNVEQTNQQTQASLAMNSFLSGTISSQINSVLGNVIKNRDWNFGANISTGTEGWNNAEYEGIINGSLFNNRLLLNGQFGYRDNANTATSSFIGDFDVRYLLTQNGNVSLHMYNQANDRYFTRTTLNTQGVGLIIKRDFSNWRDLWKKDKK